MRKISPPPGFDSQTVQPVASRYTDRAIQPTHLYKAYCSNDKTTGEHMYNFVGNLHFRTAKYISSLLWAVC